MLHQSWVPINNRLDNDMTAKRRILAFESSVKWLWRDMLYGYIVH